MKHRHFQHLGLTTEGPDRRLLGAMLVVFVGITLLAAADLRTDLQEGTSQLHALLEGCLVGAGLLGAFLSGQRFVAVLRQQRTAEALVRELSGQLQDSREEAKRWRLEAQELLAGLSDAIDLQFERWGLTPKEREVARLLLKGLSHKEIAAIREVSEATSRQQARSLYKKAGLLGRHDLAAFFLEDLLTPPASASRANRP